MRLSSINSRILQYPFLLLMVMGCAGICLGQTSPVDRQTHTSDADQQRMARLITASYTPWQTVELSGSLHADKLPLNPSVKIIMEYNRMVQISVRAPFVGEVVRIDVSTDSIIAVNKLKRAYWAESLDEAVKNMPLTVGALQDLLLERIFLLDAGTLSTDNHTRANISREPDCWLVVPGYQPMDGRVQYGFMVDDAGQLGATYITTDTGSHTALCEYVPEKDKTKIDVSVETDGKLFFASLKLNEPKWGATLMKSAQIKSNYRRVYSAGEFIKSF